jgi:hypothetical protein
MKNNKLFTLIVTIATLCSSCHVVFVWTLKDVFGLIIVAALVLLGLVLLGAYVFDKITNYFKRLFNKK